ncbi:predicted protein [Chaetomium globosum CBS 148.51]|uniref:Uncharacterized protein n=1 Tax=Chaetomium globosum (strain ATCC 6205 / CBS 148.51 / DSM 1962 / NBRC 6347 / NRRL 1970) TaxID=306901 RepID=Q2H6P6_CHAGB|nr:uncharacterized protein CHGG_05669 [Chaetomium globosum CBS 148.51]EAQ89050.1 predicted protein [Chaetomium globosum CBS 148.51]
MKTPSSSTPNPPKPSGLANLKHDGSSTRPVTLTVPDQLTPQRKTDGVFPGVRKHRSAGSSIDDASAQPYRQVTRPWASRHPTKRAVNVSNDQEMTPMDRWVSQNIKDEMWNDIHGVYGTYSQQDGGDSNISLDFATL